MPTESVQKYHLLRTKYVLHLFFSPAYENAKHCFEHEKYGYANIGGSVVIKWDDDLVQVPNNDQPKRKCGCGRGGCTGQRKNACQACFWSCKPCSFSCQCKGSCGNPHNLVGYCDRCRQNDNVNNADLADTAYNDANDMFGKSELDCVSPTITDIINVNVNSHENITGSVPINEDGPYGVPSSSENSSSDESSDEEFIGRPLLRCPISIENDLTYGENDEMYRDIGLALEL